MAKEIGTEFTIWRWSCGIRALHEARILAAMDPPTPIDNGRLAVLSVVKDFRLVGRPATMLP